MAACFMVVLGQMCHSGSLTIWSSQEVFSQSGKTQWKKVLILQRATPDRESDCSTERWGRMWGKGDRLCLHTWRISCHRCHTAQAYISAPAVNMLSLTAGKRVALMHTSPFFTSHPKSHLAQWHNAWLAFKKMMLLIKIIWNIYPANPSWKVWVNVSKA